MKKILLKISACVLVALLICTGLAGCNILDNISGKKQKLPKPEVVIGYDGTATWGEIENALYYAYIIDDGEEQVTVERAVMLEINQAIKVKAVSGNDKFLDSDFCTLKRYNPTIKKLAAPEVVIGFDGTATWKEVENTLHYVYVIDGVNEKITTERTVKLELNQTIKVKAVSNSKLFTDSDFSSPQRYVSTEKPANCTHTDNDGNGKCDLCGVSVTVELSFFSINDLHGKFMDTANQPGMDEFTTYMKNLYADTSREEILLSAGDMWQGTVESSTNKGQLMTRWMNEMKFEGMALGNHEFDWGADVLLPNSQKAEFPFLAINVKYNGKAADFCQGSTVVERGGVKIGVIGAIGDCLSSISGEFSTGLSFTTGSALTALVKAEATRLRAEGCRFIVYTIHDGYGDSLAPTSVTTLSKSDFSHYYDTSLSDGYIDLVFEGHTHQSYIVKDDYGVIHMQGGGENKYVSRADVSLNILTSSYTVKPALVSKSVYAASSIKGDAVVGEIFNEFFPENNPYTTVLGRNGTKRNSEEICETVAKLYYEAGKAKWGEYNIVLGGGYLKTRSPYDLASGNVTYADLFSILPFDNAVVLGKIKGSDLKNQFLGGKSNYYIYSTIKSSEVSDNTYYYIITDTYSAYYKYNRVTEVARLDNQTYARDLLAKYITGGGFSSY